MNDIALVVTVAAVVVYVVGALAIILGLGGKR